MYLYIKKKQYNSKKNNYMSRWHTDIWSHPGHYLVDHYTWPWSSNGHGYGHEWPPTPFFQCQSALTFSDTAI